MSEEEEDFATMFEASVKARQFEQGQTIEGTIVAFGPEVAFVSVGGKSCPAACVRNVITLSAVILCDAARANDDGVRR